MKLFQYFILGIGLVCSTYTHAGELPGNSLYQMNSTWINQDGHEIELASLRGKATILSMVYLSCQYICPTVISEVQNIESKLDQKTKDKIQIVLVSFDPIRDTPPIMKSYAEKRKLNLQRWMFLTNPNESKIRELAVALNFKYQKNANGDFTHSFMIFVLDEDGVIQAHIEGANQDLTPLIKALENTSSFKK